MAITPSEVSDNLGIPVSTLRRWAVRFEKYLSPQAPGRHRVYTHDDLETFRDIRDLASKGMSLQNIENSLAVRKAPPEPEPEPIPQGDNPQAASGESALMVMAVSGEVGKQGAKIENLQAQIDKQNRRLAALTEYLSLPWYKRIGKRPPIEY
jgi:DNA-binding transcriptional MerR regulator